MTPSPNDQSIFITGAAGFLGGHLGNRLVELGNQVYGLDSYFHASNQPLNFKCEPGDVRWPDLLLMRIKNADVVVHLAAAINVDFSAHDPESTYDVNLQGTLNVLEACRKLDKPLIFASSSEVYGTAQTKAMSETHPLDGQSPYAASKIAADRACYAWIHAYGMDVRILRCFNVMGPWQANDGYGGVVAKFTRAALRGKPLEIYGDGSQRRDYTYVDDAVEAYLFALMHTLNGPLNIGTGTTVSVSGVAERITEIIGSGTVSHISPRKGEVDCLRCDWSKARELGWQPRLSFDDGLRKYIGWAKACQVSQ